MKNSSVRRSLTFTFIAVLLMTPALLMGQQLDMDKFEAMKPRNIGPAGMSGRVTAIDVIRENPDVIYAGTASGGLWMSESGGVDWKPIFDDQRAASIGSIDIHQKNPSIIWVGTGEGNPRNSQTSGAGVFKSIDGGKSWTYMGLEQTRVVHRIIIHPDNPDIVYVGAQGSAWGDSEYRGLYKTTDGGATWEKILYNNERTGIGDLVMDPKNPNKLFAAMWEYRRWPWFFESGGEGSGLYMTLDGGENWTELTHDDGLPEGKLGRIGLAIAASNTDRVYAWVESKQNAIYRSNDGGYTWEKTVDVEENPDAGNRPFYYADIYVDPKNENRVYSLYTYLSISEDGAKSFESIYPYYNYIHPDHHAFYIHPDDPSFIIEGNDGGMNISHDRAETWRFVENLPVAQYYHISVDMDYPYNVYGGMQDNGSWQGPAYVWRNGGIRNGYFQELYFGDGFDVVVDSSDSRYAYAMSQQGYVGRVDLQTGHANFIQPVHPDDVELRFNWNAAIAADPFDDETVYFGSQYVHRSTDRGDSWEIISPDLTTNDPAKQRQHLSGGLTLDATGAENFTTITAIDPSSIERNVIWAGTDDGNIQVTRDGGENWTNVANNLRGVPEGSWVAQVHASKHRPGEAFAVINNYRRDNWTPYLMRTRDYGRRWENIVEGDGLYGYTLSFTQDPVEPRLMFVGTEMGLYVSIDEGETWTEWEPGYPTVSTYDMKIHPREHDLVIGTFGRSAWVLDDIRPLRELARQGAGALDRTITLYPAPDAYLAAEFEAAGTRFSGDAIFRGENRPMGARLTYSVVKPEESSEGINRSERQKAPPPPISSGQEERDEKDEEEKVNIQVYNQAGELIRKLEVVPEYEGMNRTVWDLDMKGVHEPSREKPDPDAAEPSGPDVLPGIYKVKMTYRGVSDSTSVRVHFDPRIEVSLSDLRARLRMHQDLMDLQSTVAGAVNNLLDAREMIGTAETMLNSDKMEGNDEQIEALTKRSAAVKDSIDALLDFVFGEEIEKQGITAQPEPTIADRLDDPEYYISSGFGGPGGTERTLMRKAREAAGRAVSRINAFFETEWPDYVGEVEAAELSPFRQFERVEME